MRQSILVLAVLAVLLAGVGPTAAQSAAASPSTVTATLELSQQFYYAGEPFMVRVSIGNDGDRKVDNPVKRPLLSGFKVRSGDRELTAKGSAEEREPARPAKLAPRTFYGAVVDLTELFPDLKQVGDYEIGWSADGVASRILMVKILPKYDPSKRYSATIDTNKGTIQLDFLADVSPIAVKAFIDMANAGFYDGLLFQEVHRDWFVAGGDPQFAETPRMPFIYPAEQSSTPLTTGTVVMRPVRPSPPANGSQFMILLRPEPQWTGQVTVVGQVVKGMDVVREISRVPSSLQSSRPHFKPLEDVRIRKVTVQEKPAAAASG